MGLVPEKSLGTKRELISKAQKLTLLEVLIASLLLGMCVVLANFLFRYIGFNTKVIDAKNEAISGYDVTLRNVGACEDRDRNGRLTDSEIQNCKPNTLSLEKVVASLRYNIYEVMARNEDLELVARKRDEDECYDDDGKAIDYTIEYKIAVTEAEKQRALSSARLCSSLRVISDALPVFQKTEALMASLDALFIEAGVKLENFAPGTQAGSSLVDGVGVIPVSFKTSGTGVEVMRALEKIEKSIRQFDITSATLEWSTKGLNFTASADAYYLTETFVPETTKTVRAK